MDAEQRRKWVDEFCDMDSSILFADGLDDALIGVCHRFGQQTIAAYDYNKCIEIFIRNGMTHGEAVDWFDYNVIGAYVGETTPCFITMIEDDE